MVLDGAPGQDSPPSGEAHGQYGPRPGPWRWRRAGRWCRAGTDIAARGCGSGNCGPGQVGWDVPAEGARCQGAAPGQGQLHDPRRRAAGSSPGCRDSPPKLQVMSGRSPGPSSRRRWARSAPGSRPGRPGRNERSSCASSRVTGAGGDPPLGVVQAAAAVDGVPRPRPASAGYWHGRDGGGDCRRWDRGRAWPPSNPGPPGPARPARVLQLAGSWSAG